MEKLVFEIDGARFSDYEGFIREMSELAQWNLSGLDALNDLLYGGMGTPFDHPFTLVWKNSALSREQLGYDGTLKFYQRGLQNYSHGLSYDKFIKRMQQRNKLQRIFGNTLFVEVNLAQARDAYRYYEEQIALAKLHQGDTIFDWIMAVFQGHPEVELRLE